MKFIEKLKAGLQKTKKALADGIENIFRAFVRIDEDLFDELEELLITSDVGVDMTETILDNLRENLKAKRITDGQEAKKELYSILRECIGEGGEIAFEDGKMTVILVIGVNGVGKTTSIAKISSMLKSEGKKVVLAAADTFRAAAAEQLTIWAERVGVDIIKGNEGSDPAAVVFDAASAAKKRQADVLIIDTAGRLHNKKNLMDELGKINRVVDRELPDAIRETLLVLDATTGQNAVVQAKEFENVAELTGIILTKLDGTAKGGIVFSIKHELGVPVKYIGVGEKAEDFQKFDPDEFVSALFGD